MSEYHCGLYLLATHQVPLLWIGQLACIYDFIIKQKKKRLQLCFFLLIVCLPIMILGAVDQRPTNPSSKAKVIDWDKLQAQIEEEEKEEELKDDATTDADTQRTMNKKTCEPHLSPYP
ncbi:hypothetical protein CK203_086619 [Vitis vinifera]|uniref:Uncharacterized protein n=1 Tax=Vitis vinifera TaxID=29760 RepID=A0A438E5N1_VITVI|nr:hypothetical protein CK203_086619 [Vitis vinifera]